MAESLHDYAKDVFVSYEKWLETDSFMDEEFEIFQEKLDKMFLAMGFIKEPRCAVKGNDHA